jgi:hypothetical protein
MFLLTAGDLSLDLNDYSNTGLAISAKDLGAPTVREVVNENPGQDGVEDDTLYFGQRVINITGRAFNLPTQSRSKAWDLMQPFLDPKVRATLTYQMDDDMDPRQLTNLRIAQWSKAASSPTAFAFQVQWKGDPVALDQNQDSISITSAFSSTIGRVYNRTYDMTYPTGPGGSGIGRATSNGTYSTWPIYRIYGPCTNPVISILDNDTGVVDSLIRVLITINPTDYIEVNTQARTVMLNGMSNRYSFLDFPNSSWQPMEPGLNTFLYAATAGGGTSYCVILWNDAFLA